MDKDADSPPQTAGKPAVKTISLSTYVAVVFVISLLISALSFFFFWSSSTKELAVGIQHASKAEAVDPFLFSDLGAGLETTDGILKTKEIDRLIEQADRLLEPLNPSEDFDFDIRDGSVDPLEF